MAKAIIESAVWDTYQGKPNVNCFVRIQDGEHAGKGLYCTIYFGNTVAPGFSKTDTDRSVEVLKAAGCTDVRSLTFGTRKPVDATVKASTTKTGAFKVYLNPPVVLAAKAPPSKADIDALFALKGEDDNSDIPF